MCALLYGLLVGWGRLGSRWGPLFDLDGAGSTSGSGGGGGGGGAWL